MVTLALFALALVLCIVADWELLIALTAGLLIFAGYSVYKKHTVLETARMLLSGMRTVRPVLITFVLIGLMTAVWRTAGTIPYILYYATGLIQPRVFVLCAFLLCCGVSFLMGTAFGTVGTVGVVCMLLSNAASLNPLVTAGAILAGGFFGDRCSPMSSSAQLVCALTGTDTYRNIKNMLRSALLPFLLCCALYLLLPGGGAGAQVDASATAVFARAFRLHWLSLVPAALILVLSAFHVHVWITMAASVVSGCLISLLMQGVSGGELLRCLVAGYTAHDAALGTLLDGGGMASMLRVGLIVLVSSSYSGIFSQTPLLSGVRKRIERLSLRTSPLLAMSCASLLSCGLGCNQTLGTILTHQLCGGLYGAHETEALALEDTVIVLAPLIPWSIAGLVPLSILGVPKTALIYAFFLYLLPLFRLLTEWIGRRRGAVTPCRKPGTTP